MRWHWLLFQIEWSQCPRGSGAREAGPRPRRLWGARPLHYRARVSEPPVPGDMIDRAVPDLEFPSSQGGTFRLRSRVGVGPLALFFYIRNATPG